MDLHGAFARAIRSLATSFKSFWQVSENARSKSHLVLISFKLLKALDKLSPANVSTVTLCPIPYGQCNVMYFQFIHHKDYSFSKISVIIRPIMRL